MRKNWQRGNPASKTERTSFAVSMTRGAAVNIAELPLDVRTYNCLRAGRIESVEQLLSCPYKELRAIPNFGEKSFHRLCEALLNNGLQLPWTELGEKAVRAGSVLASKRASYKRLQDQIRDLALRVEHLERLYRAGSLATKVEPVDLCVCQQ